MTSALTLNIINDEPRMLDTDLATALGFERPRKVRELITSNMDELVSMGSLAPVEGKSRGQEFTAYYLNEEQALLVCMFSRTTNAQAVRKQVIEIDGAPWFSATDVCRVLGLGVDSGSTMHLRKLDNDERQTLPPNLVEGFGRGCATATLISEAGLYKLIAKSDKPAARAFDRWVRHEVLPAIRKTGGYLLNEEARDTAKADDRQAMPMPELWRSRPKTTTCSGLGITPHLRSSPCL